MFNLRILSDRQRVKLRQGNISKIVNKNCSFPTTRYEIFQISTKVKMWDTYRVANSFVNSSLANAPKLYLSRINEIVQFHGAQPSISSGVFRMREQSRDGYTLL